MQTHKDWQHVLQLLLNVYNIHNHYCIHVDNKSVALFEKVEELVQCLPNVFLTNRFVFLIIIVDFVKFVSDYHAIFEYERFMGIQSDIY